MIPSRKSPSSARGLLGPVFRETAPGLGRLLSQAHGRVVRAEKKWRRLVDQCARSARPRVAESSGHDPRQSDMASKIG